MNNSRKKFFRVITFSLCILMAGQSLMAQQNEMKKRFGLKAGLNFPVLNFQTTSQHFENGAGSMVGGFFSYPSKRIGYRAELIFSRQGYDYRANTQTGTVMLDYIMLPQLMTFNITRFVQLQAGAQLAILLRADVDSSANPSSIPYFGKAKDYFNKLNYGFAGGLEVSPLAGLAVGGRYNIFFNPLKEEQQQYPAYIPNKNNIKNGLLQLYLSYSF